MNYCWKMVQPVAVVMVLAVVAMAGQTHAQCLAGDPSDSRDASVVTSLGVRLQQELMAASKDNVFFSPYSVWSALTLAYLGAQGTTEAQMRQGLGVSSQAAALRLLRKMEALYQTTGPSDASLSFDQANKVYIYPRLQIKQCLESLLHKDIAKLDFIKKEEAAQTINEFVNTTTKGLIPTIVTPDMLHMTVMAIINAIYFKGTWKFQFDPLHTARIPFRSTPQAERVPIDMMRMKNELHMGTSQELGAHVLELPYTSEFFAMYVLLPVEEGEEALMSTLQAMNPWTLETAIQTVRNSDLREVDVVLPKFKIETLYGKQVMMNALVNMGMVDMFDSFKANFTNFGEELHVGTVVHKAYIEVDEEGTEAAAATAVLINVRIAKRNPTFRCDRPFVFLIRDSISRAVIFMGVYRNPQQ